MAAITLALVASIMNVLAAESTSDMDMCMKNFIMTFNGNSYDLSGSLTAVSPDEPCQSQSPGCGSNRTYWINQRDTSYSWWYRATSSSNGTAGNWVYGRPGSDRIACAPGDTESPLDCTLFVYASDSFDDGSYTNYTLTAGACINEPTTLPTSSPTMESQCLNMCMDNFEMTYNGNTYTLNGLLKAILPNEPCEYDVHGCGTNRTYWVNQRDTSYSWYYRSVSTDASDTNGNWVYGSLERDLIGCAPGDVESPLDCTTFVYASDGFDDGSYTDYVFQRASCDSSTNVIDGCTTTSTVVAPAPTAATEIDTTLLMGGSENGVQGKGIWICLTVIAACFYFM